MSDESLLTNTTLWYSVAVAVFVALFMWKGWKPMLGWLDSEIAKIQDELAEAKRLHEEAEKTLEEYKAKQKEAEAEAARIVDQAKKDAVRLREEAERDVKIELERHEALAVNRINLAEADAREEVRKFIIEEVMREVREKVSKGDNASQDTKLVDNIISDIPKLKSNG